MHMRSMGERTWPEIRLFSNGFLSYILTLVDLAEMSRL